MKSNRNRSVSFVQSDGGPFRSGVIVWVPLQHPLFQRAPLTINTIISNVISDSCMGQGPSGPRTKFQKIMIWLVWIMIIAGGFISANSEQTL